MAKAYVAAAFVALLSSGVYADTPILTPSGAERSGSKEAMIPDWEGAQGASGWSFGKKRADFFKYKNDKPLLSIDASNVEKYSKNLSPGQIATIKQVPGFKMDVYPTRRACGIPDFVADNTRKNVGVAKIADNGWSLAEAIVPGFPFVEPKSGVEAMWNMKMRYRGVGIDYPQISTMVSPRKGGTDWIKAEAEQTEFFPLGVVGSRRLSTLTPVELNVLFSYRSPAALAGGAAVITIFLNQAGSETQYYFPGQRRVRRMPSYAYDAPQIGFENQYTLDEPFVFTGTLDRFDWKLIGKKELYVPYNSFGAYDFTAKMSDVLHNNGLSASHRRYEMHRVWVVEATVKAGSRHIAPKRTFYLDEDSWNALLAEDYDAQGNIFKVREGYLIPIYETGTCDVSAFAQYNLTEGRMVFDMSPIAGGKDMHWFVNPGEDPKLKASFYTADNLRAISDR